MNSARMLLSIQNLEIDYPSRDGHGRVTAVKGLNLALEPGEIGCLLGSSGCGKSTVLRAICGFEPIKTGEIQLRDKVVSSESTHIPPSQRRVGMVFQKPNPFPKSIYENVAYGPRLHGMATSKAALERRLT